MAPRNAFAVWITGLPASGKSTLARTLRSQLEARGVDVAVLESDVLRPIFTPGAGYQRADRDQFYRQIAYVGALLTRHGVPVIFDATANLRQYREHARQQIPKFLEVFVDCPLATCMERDPKGIYRKAKAGEASTVPGIQEPYEPPVCPDVTIRSGEEPVEAAAGRIVQELEEKGMIPAG